LTKNVYEFVQFVDNFGQNFKDKLQKKKTEHVTKKIWKTGSTQQRHKSGRLKHAGIEANVTTVDELVSLINDEGLKQAHRSTCHIPTKMDLI